MSRPAIPKEEATRYAKVLNEIGSKYDFDPLLAVSMIHYESRWLPGAASDDGEDYGLGQVRARFVGACRGEEDPVHAPSDACKAVKANLLAGEVNLRQMGVIIGANKKMCVEKRGKMKPELWIAGYQGLSQPERNKWCTPGPTTTRVMDYHKELLATLSPKPKAVAAKVPAKGAVAAKTPVVAKGAVAAKAPVAAKGTAPTAAKSAAAAKAPAKAPAKVAPAKAAPAKATPAKAAPGKPAKSSKGPRAQGVIHEPRHR